MIEHMDPMGLLVFAEVAQHGSFSGAARASGRSRQAIHRQIDDLETKLGVRLFERSTRSFRITDIGLRLLEHAERVRTNVLSAEEEMRAARAAPSGTLRLTAPELLGEMFVAPVIAQFLDQFPTVRIETSFSTEQIDLITGRFDLAIRVGSPGDSGLKARLLGRAVVVCCASQQYLNQAPELVEPRDLSSHQTLHYGRDVGGTLVEWAIDNEAIRLRPRLAATSARTIRDAAMRGLGVARLPLLACAPELESGELIEVLAQWRETTTPIYAVYVSQAATNPTTKAFLDLLKVAAENTLSVFPRDHDK